MTTLKHLFESVCFINHVIHGYQSASMNFAGTSVLNKASMYRMQTWNRCRCSTCTTITSLLSWSFNLFLVLAVQVGQTCVLHVASAFQLDQISRAELVINATVNGMDRNLNLPKHYGLASLCLINAATRRFVRTRSTNAGLGPTAVLL